jgi:hypothetical protein
MLQACGTTHMDVAVQAELDLDDNKFEALVKKKDEEFRRLKHEKNKEIKELKSKLEVRNVVMFHTNFRGTLIREFLCVMGM